MVHQCRGERVLFNKQRYEFFSKSQLMNGTAYMFGQVLFNKQRYEFFSKSQHFMVLFKGGKGVVQ